MGNAVTTSETWKPIPGYDGYEASDLGNVRSHIQLDDKSLAQIPYLLKQTEGEGNYHSDVYLHRGGKRYPRNVDALVLLAFCGPRPKGEGVYHVNGNAGDNSLENLCYSAESPWGEICQEFVPLSGIQAAKMRECYASGESILSLASAYGINIHEASRYILTPYKKIESQVLEPGDAAIGGITYRKSKGYVYLLQCGSHYKIGRTMDPRSRVSSIQTSTPYEVSLVHIISTNDMNSLESNLHRRFAGKRGRGEWFELNLDDVEYIKGIASPNKFGTPVYHPRKTPEPLTEKQYSIESPRIPDGQLEQLNFL